MKGKHGWSLTLASAVFICRTEMYLFAGVMFLYYAWKREWKILPLVYNRPPDLDRLVGCNLWRCDDLLPGMGQIFKYRQVYSRSFRCALYYALTQHFRIGAGASVCCGRRIYSRKETKFRIHYHLQHYRAHAYYTHAGRRGNVPLVGKYRRITIYSRCRSAFGIVAVYGFSEVLERIRPAAGQLIFSLIVLAAAVFQCTMETQPRRWANYDRIILRLTKEFPRDSPVLTLLCNHPAAAYVLDVPPIGGKHLAQLNLETLRQYPQCIVLWEPFFSNSIFSQTKLTKEKILQDSAIEVIDRYRYWNAEYLVLHKKGNSALTSGIDH